MMKRNILLLAFLAFAVSKHSHHEMEKIETEVMQTPITYVAAVTVGYPVSTSSDWISGTFAFQGIINRQPARGGSGIYDAWQAGYLNKD